MSIRFHCTACQTVLKIGQAISEVKKVRCTGCGIVIVLTPDADQPNGMSVTIPQQSGVDKARAKDEAARKRVVLIAAAALGVVILLIAGYWMFSGPSDRGSIEGDVTVDGAKLEKGSIVFTSLDENKKVVATGAIVDGRFYIRAGIGPAIGPNKVEVHGERATGKRVSKPGGDPSDMIDEVVELVAKEFNTETKLQVNINKGSNKVDFPVKSR